MPTRNKTIDDAVETFVTAFAFGRSQTHPYEAVRFGEVWAMRDRPRKNPRDYRKEEWIAYDVPAADVDATARANTRGRFFVGAVIDLDECDDRERADYKALGYRLMAREGFFTHSLDRIPRFSSPAPIGRVRTADMAARLGKATRSKPISAEQLTPNAPFRQYVATADDTLIGWVRSTNAGQNAWVSDMFVSPAHRRRGIGRALLAKMLRDDRTHARIQSVLLASKAGALLYPHVGYKQIGTLLIFAPATRRP